MATEVRPIDTAPAVPREEGSLIDLHFAKVAFAVSALILFILQPLTFLFGLAAGGWGHYTFEPNPRIENLDQVMTVSHASLAIVAAVAAVLALTPSGSGIFFQGIAPLFALSIGSSAYLGYQLYTRT